MICGLTGTKPFLQGYSLYYHLICSILKKKKKKKKKKMK